MGHSTAEIWERFSEELHRYLSRRVDNPLDADDLLQEIFIKIHTHIDSLREQDRIVPWVYSIARNTLNDFYRTRKVHLEIPEDLTLEDEIFKENPEAELALGLQGMIDQLPEKYRQPLELFELQGVKQSEIGAITGLSLSGAKSRLQRGREKLRQSLLDCCHFEFDRRGRIIDYLPKQECCALCNC